MKTKADRKVKITKDTDQWKVQQLFGKFKDRLNRMPDAGEVQRNALRSAPPGMTDMVF